MPKAQSRHFFNGTEVPAPSRPSVGYVGRVRPGRASKNSKVLKSFIHKALQDANIATNAYKNYYLVLFRMISYYLVLSRAISYDFVKQEMIC